jgi:hypothetical protein
MYTRADDPERRRCKARWITRWAVSISNLVTWEAPGSPQALSGGVLEWPAKLVQAMMYYDDQRYAAQTKQAKDVAARQEAESKRPKGFSSRR